jgi:hypothetical protein
MVQVQSCELDALFSVLLSNGFGLLLSLADVTMGTKACNLPNAVKLYYIKLNKLSRIKCNYIIFG